MKKKMILNLRKRKRLFKNISLYGGSVLTIILLCVAKLYIPNEDSKKANSGTMDKIEIPIQKDVPQMRHSGSDEKSSTPIQRLNPPLKLPAKVKKTKPSGKTPKETHILLPRRRDKNIKTILTWNDFFSMKHYSVGEGTDPFKRHACKVFNCELWHRLDSIETLPHDEYDALVFHGIDTGNSSIEDLPLVRRPHQRYIFSLGESPAMRPHVYNMTNFFNWTATYRHDSDLFSPYVVIKSKTTGKVVHEWMTPTFQDMSRIPKSISSKTKLVAWFSSNSHSQSRRHTYAESLSEHISLDIYGEDKALKCPRNASKECDEMLERDYKFYLAFENSLCDDYLTEKILRPFRYNTVPIVYGGADYTRLLPPHSYINVRDFKSPRQLADYLYFLNENPDEYHKYFWWKQYYYEDTGTSFWCNLCEKLNKAHEPNKVYPDIESWWFYPNVCQSVEEHFKKEKKSSRITSNT